MAAKVRAARAAKSGDLGARLELTLGWIGDVASGKQKLSAVQVVVAGVLGALAIVGGGAAYMHLKSKALVLTPSDTAGLKEVFFSGQPWLVECTSAGSPSSVMYAAESKLRDPVRPALLDCGAKLPSGKTTLERFKLKAPSHSPFIIAVANLEKPQVAGRDIVASPEALAKWASSMTKARVLTPNSPSQFEQYCLNKRWCVAVVSAGSRLVDAERKALNALVQAERGVRFVTVDASKYSLLADVPGGLPEPSAAASTLVLLKQVDGEGGAEAGGKRAVAAAVLPTGLSDVPETARAISEAMVEVSGVPAGFELLAKRPALRTRVVPSKPAPAKAAAKPKEPASKTYTDEELAALREERKRLQLEAEKERREKMAAEEAAQGNLVEDVSEEEGSIAYEAEDGDEEEGEGEEEEPEAMELDDE